MASTEQTKPSALIIGANGYIGNAVAQAFQKAGYRTYGMVRSNRSAVTLETQSIVPIIGSAADGDKVIKAIQLHTKALEIIVCTTHDSKDYPRHFNDTMKLVRALAITSNNAGVRPLLLFTSGCKDYGPGAVDGSPDLQMHTEDFPLRPPPFLADRCNYAMKVFEETTLDSAVIRPTNVHGGTSSNFGSFFEMAKAAKAKDDALHFNADPRTIIHSLNNDDCAEAYVALAEHPNRAEVAGQSFNISPGGRYETLRDVGDALAKVYGIRAGVQFDEPFPSVVDGSNALTAFSQWVGSEKIRRLTGWRERRPLFAEGLEMYRTEYETAEVENGNSTK